jgi:hypothetical protein
MMAMVRPQTWMDGKIIGLSGAALAGALIFAGGFFALGRGLPAALGRPALTMPPIVSADSSAAALASVRTARTPRAAAAVSLPAPVDEVVGEVAEVTVPVVDDAPDLATPDLAAPDLAAPDLAAVTTEVAATSAPAEPIRGELRRSARAVSWGARDAVNARFCAPSAPEHLLDRSLE